MSEISWDAMCRGIVLFAPKSFYNTIVLYFTANAQIFEVLTSRLFTSKH